MGMAVLEGSRSKAGKLAAPTGLDQIRYALFSRGGFCEDLLRHGRQNNVLLVAIEDRVARRSRGQLKPSTRPARRRNAPPPSPRMYN